MKSRIPVLDGLRGIAVTIVILVHVNLLFGGMFGAPGSANKLVSGIFGAGWIGVDLFFALSGFLITGILVDSREEPHFFRNFYARRALRIMPLYYGFLLLACVIAPRVAPSYPYSAALRESTPSLALYYYNFQIAFNESSLVPMINHFWSLCVEEHFYLCWPMLCFWLRPRLVMKVCVAGAVLSLLLRIVAVAGKQGQYLAYVATPCRLDGLLAGSFVAIAWRDPACWPRLRAVAPALVWAGALLVLGIGIAQRHFVPIVDATDASSPDTSIVRTAGLSILAILFASIIVVLVEADSSSRVRKALENRFLRSVGQYSYCIYVIHQPVLMALRAIQWRYFAQFDKYPDYVTKPLFSIAVFVCSYLGGWLSYRLYERHFLKLKDRFAPEHVRTAVPRPDM